MLIRVDEQELNDEYSEPTLAKFYRAAALRDLLTQGEMKDMDRLEKGIAGEEIVCDFIRTEGKPDWILLRNHWLYEDGPFECDFILMTHHVIYTFEVKHYTGRFTYENGACSIGNIKMENDCIQQARKSYLKLLKIIKKWRPNATVNGALVFSSNKNKVVIQSPVADIEVLSSLICMPVCSS